ncbi:MAG: alpha amylase C-terminal domain-containing protein, partial [Candidatus Saccharibacteria bacterium]|nr:alpha amylase C-terminal domain-containing protein [Pseudorhodobacter sp.]
NDTRPEGFMWLEGGDAEGSTFVWARKGGPSDGVMIAAINLTPIERRVRIGLTAMGHWDEILNTDASDYGGGNRGNLGGIDAEATPWHGQAQSALVTLPPLSAVYFLQA